MFGAGAKPASEATLTILRTPPAARIAGRNARMQCTMPSTLMSKMRRHSDSGVCSKLPRNATPALFTSTSTGPTVS
jgi:hypothetical protein